MSKSKNLCETCNVKQCDYKSEVDNLRVELALALWVTDCPNYECNEGICIDCKKNDGTVEGERTYKITSCARCGNDHEGIFYKKFTNPVILGDLVMTHWTLCPDLDEPILMYFVEQTEIDR